MLYIQRQDRNNLETVDEARSPKDARILVIEYRLSDPFANYYISRRCCREWKH